jgi:hypothetical protein
MDASPKSEIHSTHHKHQAVLFAIMLCSLICSSGCINKPRTHVEEKIMDAETLRVTGSANDYFKKKKLESYEIRKILKHEGGYRVLVEATPSTPGRHGILYLDEEYNVLNFIRGK